MEVKEFKALMLDHGIKSKDIAAALGISPQTVYNGLQPGRKLPIWAKGIAFGLSISQRSAVKNDTEQPVKQQEPIKQEFNGVYACGCKLSGKLFTRSQGCKIDRTKH